ncbi:hypothetical protein CSUI_010689, partial [Cystoisospora suis]
LFFSFLLSLLLSLCLLSLAVSSISRTECREYFEWMIMILVEPPTREKRRRRRKNISLSSADKLQV